MHPSYLDLSMSGFQKLGQIPQKSWQLSYLDLFRSNLLKLDQIGLKI